MIICEQSSAMGRTFSQTREKEEVMKKCSKAIVMAAVCVFGLVAIGFAADGSYEDIIDKIKIKAIHRIEIKDGNVLGVTVRFENSSDKKVKFTKGRDFAFSIGTWDRFPAVNKKSDKCPSTWDWDETKIIDPVMLLGTETFDEKDEIEKNGSALITFNIKMEDAKASDALKHLIHCIGYPSKKQPFIPIKGNFELAIYSESKRGWTTARDLAIEWKFVPCMQEKVDFLPGN